MDKTISTSAHAFLDYLSSLTLLAGPWIFDFQDDPRAKAVSLLAGATIALNSFFTHYEGGVVRLLPMRIHLIFDILIGLFLIASPWLLNFAQGGYAFHIILGSISLAAGFSTWPKPPQDLSK